MKNQENKWAVFWRHQKHSFDEVMKVSTAYFAKEFINRLHVTSAHEIFDYGCGPGFLADSLVPNKIPVTGADINTSYLEQCRSNHPGYLFIPITTDTSVNKQTLNEHLKGRKFDFIILLSISQYLETVDELEKIIQLLQQFLKENGKIVIADVVDSDTSALRDVTAILIECIKAGKTIAFIKFIFYLLFSNYRHISKDIQLLHISSISMTKLAGNSKMKCDKVDRLTLHPSRSNYVLSKT